ncbi:hypothetical protein [Pseudonocardia broussonetiae]|uniref:Uncharacterized protein n=1 Tax=Pseudonocardia broussonetiae TaxID=2736640 RepID=A0A6M6JN79_9PSEU|nr:hypothetical protein [Pseudonocardia broussonetiae]QJY48072.1 hypothetical protein HOP40_21610 [Pseudonocardia broussonetiae]
MSMLDDNVRCGDDGQLTCARCAAVLAAAGERHLHRALLRTGEVSLAGPHVRAADPPVVNERVEFRQLLCPSCGTALLTEVVAAADRDTRTATVPGRGAPVRRGS